MRTIWKFDIEQALVKAVEVDGVPVIDLEFPLGSITLDVQMQRDRPVFWVHLQDGNPMSVNRFAVVGTGWRIPPFVTEWEGTWQEGEFVWHLFAVDEELYQLALKGEAS